MLNTPHAPQLKSKERFPWRLSEHSWTFEICRSSLLIPPMTKCSFLKYITHIIHVWLIQYETHTMTHSLWVINTWLIIPECYEAGSENFCIFVVTETGFSIISIRWNVHRQFIFIIFRATGILLVIKYDPYFMSHNYESLYLRTNTWLTSKQIGWEHPLQPSKQSSMQGQAASHGPSSRRQSLEHSVVEHWSIHSAVSWKQSPWHLKNFSKSLLNQNLNLLIIIARHNCSILEFRFSISVFNNYWQ